MVIEGSPALMDWLTRLQLAALLFAIGLVSLQVVSATWWVAILPALAIGAAFVALHRRPILTGWMMALSWLAIGFLLYRS